jgi:AAA15 family ATPase/GTPase
MDMLIKFTIENWMSFRESATFSMVASRERQHGDRISRVKKYQMRVLPIAAVYGGNASGKTNFFKALSFAKNLVVKGTQPDGMIPVEPCRIDPNGTTKPSRFLFELLVNETVYEFRFAVSRKEVLEEKLTEISSVSERVLYERIGNDIQFEKSLKKDQFLNFVFQGTRDNQLFLTNSVNQKVENFKAIYGWFRDKLVLIAPDSRFEPFEQFIQENHPLYITMNEMLPKLDTGIAHLGGEDVPFDNLPLPEPLRAKLQEDVTEGKTVRLLADPMAERFVITRKDGELTAKKLVTYHQRQDGSEVKFEMRQETDGSQRVIDLLPAFLSAATTDSSNVYVIDELDRSLHTLLIRQLLEGYLSCSGPDTRSQLLFTTHDVLLMDQKLFRRDEMWVVERTPQGESSLVSFSEYKDVRYDKDIRKSYLQGRLGGVPHILIGGVFMDTCKPSGDNL